MTASRRLLKGSDMVFVAAGVGRRHRHGGAPVVARIAQEIGALTVGIVTKPFGFEGTRACPQADEGVTELAKHVDTLIVIPNNRLLSVLEKGTSMVDAFRVADDVLRQGVQGISDLVTLPGLINLDFADVRTIMSDAGQALLGIGMASGEKRAIAGGRGGRFLTAARDVGRGRALDPAVDHGRPRPLAVGGQRGRPRRVRGGAPERQHHLRRDDRREDQRRVLGDRGRDRLRRPPDAEVERGRLPRARRRAARAAQWHRGPRTGDFEIPEFVPKR